MIENIPSEIHSNQNEIDTNIANLEAGKIQYG